LFDDDEFVGPAAVEGGDLASALGLSALTEHLSKMAQPRALLQAQPARQVPTHQAPTQTPAASTTPASDSVTSPRLRPHPRR
jgi:hypothetical protein